MQQEADIAVLQTVVSRIDSSIAVMSEVTTSIGKLLAVHEERINQLEKDQNLVGVDIRDLHSRITTMSRDVIAKIDETEKSLEAKIKQSNDETSKKLEEVGHELKNVDMRVGFLERWKWMVLGGATVVGYLLGHYAEIARFIK